MALAIIRPGQLYVWRGPSLLVTDARGDCGEREPLSGYYFREARFLETLRLEVNARSPWLCEASLLDTHTLAFTCIHPELIEFGGGGSGQSGDEVSTDADGLPHRALSLRAVHTLSIDSLTVSLTVSNHSMRRIEADVAWIVDADYADLQEAHEGRRDQQAAVGRAVSARDLTFTYEHPQLKYRTAVTPAESWSWTLTETTIKTRVHLDPQQAVVLRLRVTPSDTHGAPPFDDADAREECLRTWQQRLTRITVHLGTVWAVEQGTIAFGLRRFGLNARAGELAELYPEHRIPECIGGYSRGEGGGPGAYPRANTPQLWNASVFPLLIHSLLGFQPVAPLETLFVDPVLPTWLPEVVIHDLRLAGGSASLRFWRDAAGASHGEILHKRGTFRLVKQPPPESLTAGAADRLAALFDSVRR